MNFHSLPGAAGAPTRPGRRPPPTLAHLAFALLAAACGDDTAPARPAPLVPAPAPAPAPAAPSPSAPACVPVCAEGACPPGGCCPPPESVGALRLPAHVTWTEFSFGPNGLNELEVVVDIENDPGSGVGLYFAPIDSYIDDAPMYLGLQTNLNRPKAGPVGKGFIFSQFGTLERAAIRTVPGGFFEQGTHEGDFVGVRLARAWSPGRYVLRLARAEAEGEADWFEYRVREEATGDEFSVGALRFARRQPGAPATIAPSVTSFTEVYSGAAGYDRVPGFRLGFRATGDGQAPLWASSEYPAFPWAEYPYSDQWYEPSSGLIRVAFGAGTPRCHEAG
ncbi:MAG TPA: hypothetical protein VFS00_25185, partial [Polyangiaceae bacterium]|nr:hypothetical protein [Polyangiaceae bacterium]